MAERQAAGKAFFLFRGNGETVSETFDVFACSESSTINQSNSELNAVTNCGDLKLPGTSSASVDFSLIPLLEPASSKVPIDTLQDDFTAKDFHNYKITTAGAGAGGDPIWSFRAYMKDLKWEMSASDFLKGSGSLQVDGDGITCTIVS